MVAVMLAVTSADGSFRARLEQDFRARGSGEDQGLGSSASIHCVCGAPP
jgi:hypothetical protein